MVKTTEELLRPCFDKHADRLDAALRAALAQPIPMEPGRRLQFEVCPYFYRVVLTDIEEEILPDGWLDLPSEVLMAVEEAGGESPEAETEFLVRWLADGWARLGGPRQYSPAFAFFHGYHDGQFDLEQRRWLSAEEAFGEWPRRLSRRCSRRRERVGFPRRVARRVPPRC